MTAIVRLLEAMFGVYGVPAVLLGGGLVILLLTLVLASTHRAMR